MPRNSSGTYSLPVAAYVAGTTIRSTDMNTNLSDIGTALTQSLATTGVSSMTGVLKLAAGAANAPSLTLASDTTTGWYNSAVGAWTYVSAGSAVFALTSAGAAVTGTFSASGAVTASAALTVGTTLGVTGNSTLTGTLTVNNTVNIVVATSGLFIRETTNDTSEQTQVTLFRGSGAGNAWTWRTVGGGANDVTTVRGYVGSTHIISYSTSGVSPKKNLIIDAGIVIVTTAGYTDYTEIAAPSAPAANTARFYTYDFGGTTLMGYKDSAGSERPLSPPGSVIGSEYGEYTAATALSGAIPIDDTIPQVGEGDQLISFAYVKKYTGTEIRVTATGFGFNTGNGSPVLAVFSDQSNDAIAVATDRPGNSSAIHPLAVVAQVALAASGSITFQLRSGINSGTISWNASASGTRLFGGAAKVTLLVEEIAV